MEGITVMATDHREAILDQLNEFRRTNHLCDATVVNTADGREFLAHGAVLAAAGGFFSGIYNTNMREQLENKIELIRIDSDIAELVLNFIYTGKIEITSENAQQVVIAADFLLLDKLKNPVDKFLAETSEGIQPNDCLQAYQFGVQYKCSKFKEAALKLVQINFEAVVTTDTRELLLELSCESLQEIIGSDDLVVTREDVVYQVVIDWVKHKEERKELFYQLFEHIRLFSLSEEFINSSVFTETLVSSNPNCLSLLFKSTNNTCIPSDLNQPKLPRTCLDPYTDAILVFVRDHDFYLSYTIPCGLWCYIPSVSKWYFIPSLKDSNEDIFGCGLPVYYMESLYIVREDFDGTGIVIDRYKLGSNAWSEVGHLDNKAIHDYGVGCLNGIVYIVGGIEEDFDADDQPGRYLNSVYACDIKGRNTQMFRNINEVAAMNETRAECSVVSNEKHLYVIGGHSNQGDTFSKTMERYDPNSNSWEYLAPTSKGGSYSQCTLVNDKIFLVCPRNGEVSSNYCEVYSIGTDTWSEIEVSPLSVSSGILRVCRDKLYLIAPDSQRKMKKIESISYDMTTNTWSATNAMPVRLKRRRAERTPLFLGGVSVRLLKEDVSSLQELQDALTVREDVVLPEQ